MAQHTIRVTKNGELTAEIPFDTKVEAVRTFEELLRDRGVEAYPLKNYVRGLREKRYGNRATVVFPDGGIVDYRLRAGSPAAA